jgi:TatA/E family protein of Tat protein translocase
MGTLGVQEMVVIFLVALVLFGPKKLPELGRTIGKALTEFRRASSDLKATFEREMQTLDRENQSLRQMTHETANEIYKHVESYTADSYLSESQNPEHYLPPANVIPETNNPSTVSASAVPGAESHGTTPTAIAEPAVEQPAAQLPTVASEDRLADFREKLASTPPHAVEGTVARTEHAEAPQHS